MCTSMTDALTTAPLKVSERQPVTKHIGHQTPVQMTLGPQACALELLASKQLRSSVPLSSNGDTHAPRAQQQHKHLLPHLQRAARPLLPLH